MANVGFLLRELLQAGKATGSFLGGTGKAVLGSPTGRVAAGGVALTALGAGWPLLGRAFGGGTKAEGLPGEGAPAMSPTSDAPASGASSGLPSPPPAASADSGSGVSGYIPSGVKNWWSGLNQAQRDAFKNIGIAGGVTLGVGGLAGLMMNLRRKHEKRLLDEEAAKATLAVPIYSSPQKGKKKKAASVGDFVEALHIPGAKSVYDTVSGIPGYLYNAGKSAIEFGNTEKDHLLNFTDTLKGSNAKSYGQVPWFWPLALGGSMAGLAAGYHGVNSISDAWSRRKLKKKRDEAKRMVEEALRAEQNSKLGSALEEFVSAADAVMPQTKEASLLQAYLAMMLTTAGLGAGLGAYNGYRTATQAQRLGALNKVRAAQLANRRREDLMLVPQGEQEEEDSEVSLPNSSAEEKQGSVKTALIPQLARAAMIAGKPVMGLARLGSRVLPKAVAPAVENTANLSNTQPGLSR